MKPGAKVKKGAAGRKGDDPRKKSVTRPVKAGLQIPFGRIGRYLKKSRYAKCVGTRAPVYQDATVEYLAAEVLELAARNAARDYKKKRRTIPRSLQLDIRNDKELSKQVPDVSSLMVKYCQKLVRCCYQGAIDKAATEAT